MTCKLQGFLFGKLARFSFPSQRHMRLSNMRPVFSKTFSLEFIQRHCQILMLRINLGLTWPFTLVARQHPHPTPPNPRSYVACGCVASSHERQHPHPTPPNPRSYVACGCVASSHERQHPHPTPPNPTQEVT